MNRFIVGCFSDDNRKKKGTLFYNNGCKTKFLFWNLLDLFQYLRNQFSSFFEQDGGIYLQA